ncbi:hypothetical protein EDB19DRAFT_1827036 [Suillus lakei]|nr:hypothetical protein EDB19DRAFT_1827036 [Suillus lakei]
MAEYMNTELISQFTEDSYATVDQICECPSCGIQIRAGKPCLYVATINPGQVGRHVCAACYARYENKRVTSRRPKPTASSYHTIPDPRIIRQSVNAAQRKSSVNPPPVVAVSDWTNASMGPPPMSHRPHCASGPNIDPPPMSHHLHRTSGPNVAIPTSSWQGSAVSAAPLRLTGPIGYLSHHGMYATEHQRWNICEGKKDIDAPDLMRLALDTVLPKLCAFGDSFAWHDEEFTVRDSAWVDLSTHPPFELYFLLQFMQPVQGAESQWQEFELWQEEYQVANWLSQLSTNVVSPVPQVLATTSSFSTTPQLSANVISSVPQMSTTAISSTSGTMSPPQKSSIPPALQLCSPNHDQLKQVLKIGGGADLNVKQVGKLQNKNIHFYSIPTRSLSDLLEYTEYHSFSVNTVDSSVGHLTIDTSADGIIGIGGFKTAHKG